MKNIFWAVNIELDVPSKYEDGKLPILDLEVWIEKERTENGEEQLKLVYKHYSKPMAIRYVIHKENVWLFEDGWKERNSFLWRVCNNQVIMKDTGMKCWSQPSKHMKKITEDPERPKYRGI